MIKYILGYLLVLSFGNIILSLNNFNILIGTPFVNTRIPILIIKNLPNKKGTYMNYN